MRKDREKARPPGRPVTPPVLSMAEVEARMRMEEEENRRRNSGTGGWDRPTSNSGGWGSPDRYL